MVILVDIEKYEKDGFTDIQLEIAEQNLEHLLGHKAVEKAFRSSTENV